MPRWKLKINLIKILLHGKIYFLSVGPARPGGTEGEFNAAAAESAICTRNLIIIFAGPHFWKKKIIYLTVIVSHLGNGHRYHETFLRRRSLPGCRKFVIHSPFPKEIRWNMKFGGNVFNGHIVDVFFML